MRFRILAITAACSLLAPTGAAATPADVGEPTLFAGGGTNLTNGFFFPGTTFYDSETKEFTLVGPPVRVEQGGSIEFVNLDTAAVTNSHRIRSVKLRKNGRPLFQTGLVDGPDTATLSVKRVKPGSYIYLCTTHAGMFGTIEVTPKS
jgi:plastocyanin